jgi:hypothetical protein
MRTGWEAVTDVTPKPAALSRKRRHRDGTTRIARQFCFACACLPCGVCLARRRREAKCCPDGRDDDLARCMTGWMGNGMAAICESNPPSQSHSANLCEWLALRSYGVLTGLLCFCTGAH